MTDSFNSKVGVLRRRLEELKSAVVAFSGGVDSSILAALAREILGEQMCAATAVSPSLPLMDRQMAEKLCQELKIPHYFVETDEFDDPAFRSNPSDRCYHCKRHLYSNLVAFADKKGFRFVIEGTNASDLGGHRPGYKASCENKRVATPLIDAGFEKEDVRRLAAELKLSTARKPSSACLASRLPTGSSLEPGIMRRIDMAEDFIRGLGLGQVRVRVHDSLARVELDPAELEAALSHRKGICSALKEIGFKFVTLDLAGYRTGGSES